MLKKTVYSSPSNYQNLICMRKLLWVLILCALSLGQTQAAWLFGKKKADCPAPFELGANYSVTKISDAVLQDMKAGGIKWIEFGGVSFFKDAKSKHTPEQVKAIFLRAKQLCDQAGIQIWSVHMPFSDKIDISLADEATRQGVVKYHADCLEYVKLLEPKVVLFHTSWYIPKGERETHYVQARKSSVELNEIVKSFGAITVLENMLDKKDMSKRPTYETPLGRQVDCMQKLFEGMPEDIYVAVDLNHIKRPEEMIRAFGARVKTLHVSDGNGEEECHYLPGKGENDWNKIQQSLYDAGYKGVFMHEVSAKYIKSHAEIGEAYKTIYDAYCKSISCKKK